MASSRRLSGTVREMRTNPSPYCAVGGAGRDDHGGLLEKKGGEIDRGHSLGHRDPEVEGPRLRLELQADLVKGIQNQLPAAVIDVHHLGDVGVFFLEGGDRRVLNRR